MSAHLLCVAVADATLDPGLFRPEILLWVEKKRGGARVMASVGKQVPRTSTRTSYSLRLELDVLEGHVGPKADACKVGAKLCEDRVGIEARFATMGETLAAFGENLQGAFAHVAAVEAGFQAHIGHGFEKAVRAIQWLDKATDERFSGIESKFVETGALAVSALRPRGK